MGDLGRGIGEAIISLIILAAVAGTGFGLFLAYVVPLIARHISIGVR